MTGVASLSALVVRGARAEDIAAFLDALDHHERVRQCLAFPGGLHPRLFATVRGKEPLDIETFVPVEGRTTTYELKNSLPMFNVSQKRFFRPAEGETIGYNHTGAVVARFIGPGYFVAFNGDSGELVFDYTRPVNIRPPGWPRVRSNAGVVAKAVYGEMVDYVWAVSRHCAIGEAYRHGRPRGSWFLLTRAASES